MSFEHRAYESVDEKSLYLAMSQKQRKEEFGTIKVNEATNSKILTHGNGKSEYLMHVTFVVYTRCESLPTVI